MFKMVSGKYYLYTDVSTHTYQIFYLESNHINNTNSFDKKYSFRTHKYVPNRRGLFSFSHLSTYKQVPIDKKAMDIPKEYIFMCV